MELVVAVNPVRPAKSVKESLKRPIKKAIIFHGLLSCPGKLKTEAGKFNEFVEARVS
jgi:hypothetical protein